MLVDSLVLRNPLLCQAWEHNQQAYLSTLQTLNGLNKLNEEQVAKNTLK